MSDNPQPPDDNKVKATGERTPITPEMAKELARVDMNSLKQSLTSIKKTNPVLYALLLALPTDQGR